MADAYRVVVVEDDADVAFYTKTVLEKRGGCEVVTVADPSLARAVIADFHPDVVVTDIEMPGLNGLELMAQIREDRPGLPIVVMTAHISVDYAVGALNGQADEFLIKPISASDLVTAVMRLAADGRANSSSTDAGDSSRQQVLAVGVRPEDVVLGIGGLLSAHRAEGDIVTIVALTRGDGSAAVGDRQSESLALAETLGARLFLEDLVESEIAADGATLELLRGIVGEIKPTIVYIPSIHDDQSAGRAAHHAVVAATGEAATVAAYQGPTTNVEFRPSKFVSIDGYADAKLALLNVFTSYSGSSQLLEPELVLATARYWGRFGGGANVEPLEMVREAEAAPTLGDVSPATASA